LKSAPLIKGKVENISGDSFSNIPVKYYYSLDNGKFINEILTNEKGEFFIPGRQDETCSLNVGYKYKDYINVLKDDIESPSDLGIIVLASRKEFEKDAASKIIDILVKSGIPKDEANQVINGLVFEYDDGGPEFYIENPNWVKEQLGSPGWASLKIPSEQYWSNAEWFTIFHEYGHAAMNGFAYDIGAEVGKEHDIWLKTNRDTAFDEARAHFFSLLVLRSSGRKGNSTVEEFTEESSFNAIGSEQVEGNRIEGVITTFWNKVYGSQIYVCPSCVLKDVRGVQNKFKEREGRPPRTIEEWIKGEKILRQGDRIYGLANKLKINHNGPIEVGIEEDKPEKLSLQIDDGEMSLSYGGLGKERTVSGNTELEENDEIETKNSSGKIVYPDGSYIKIKPGSKVQVWSDDLIIVRNGNILTRIFKREDGFQIIMPDSNIKVVIKGTTVDVSVDDQNNSIIKVVEGEVDITDLEGNHLETLLTNQQYNSETKEISEFNADKSLQEWEEKTEQEVKKDNSEKNIFSFLWIVILIIVIIVVVTIIILVKKAKVFSK